MLKNIIKYKKIILVAIFFTNLSLFGNETSFQSSNSEDIQQALDQELNNATIDTEDITMKFKKEKIIAQLRSKISKIENREVNSEEDQKIKKYEIQIIEQSIKVIESLNDKRKK